MANAKHDENYVAVMIAASKSDGSTPVMVTIEPVGHVLLVDDGETGEDKGGTFAKRDANNVPILLAVSSEDGETPVEVYADPENGKLLIQTT